MKYYLETNSKQNPKELGWCYINYITSINDYRILINIKKKEIKSYDLKTLRMIAIELTCKRNYWFRITI